MSPLNQSNSNLPTIDFSRWTTSITSQDERLEIAKELVQACHETGFVYIINHGVHASLLAEVFEMSKRFYALTQEEKMQAAHSDGSMAFRGYSWPGLEKPASSYPGAEFVNDGVVGGGVDLTESYGIGSDAFTTDPNIWLPEHLLPGFRTLTTTFYWECWKLAQQVLGALSLGLGLPSEDYLLQFHSGHENELSLRHYPPGPESLFLKQNINRLSAHTDFDSFTLLFQDDCGGLEVQKSGSLGSFIPATPIEGALVLNIGDALMRWSDDYLTSTIHRVMPPPLQDRYTSSNPNPSPTTTTTPTKDTERTTRARYSIPYFVSPNRDCVMECLPGSYLGNFEDVILKKGKYEPITYGEYFKGRVGEVFGV